MPDGTEQAWSLFFTLARPVVQRLGLQREMIAATCGELDGGEFEDLIEQLDAIGQGVKAADAKGESGV